MVIGLIFAGIALYFEGFALPLPLLDGVIGYPSRHKAFSHGMYLKTHNNDS